MNYEGLWNKRRDGIRSMKERNDEKTNSMADNTKKGQISGLVELGIKQKNTMNSAQMKEIDGQ
jgi:hypothetical protein